ncbi:MAG TPA: peptidase E [Verrucomicrobiae bacterium]|nr:peptidase E [Verrucomicrobiae bacterium]
MQNRHIIAMGGGGFSMEPDNLRLDRYILQHARIPNPSVYFVPTASGDSDGYIVRFYTAFSTLPCRPRHLSLFRQPPDLAASVAECDVIYVGGGNTRNMLAIWRACKFDAMLRRAWESGVVLCGLSAGAICWFEHGHTDSAGALGAMECLGFLSGSCSPHYDGEAGRRPSFHSLIQQGALPAGYAIEDGAAVHFIGDTIAEVITSRPSARAFRVRREGSNIIEEPLQTRFLESTSDAKAADW